MKVLAACLLVSSAAAADIPFSRSLNPTDFSAAGLDKLTPAELRKLDDLIFGKSQGTAANEPDSAPHVGPTTVAPTPPPRDPAPRKGMLERAKVLLTPGTEIEYSTLDSTLAATFRGWEKGTIFTLENGQRWQVISTDSYSEPGRRDNVHVRIVPGALGSFFLEIDHGGRPRVKHLPDSR